MLSVYYTKPGGLAHAKRLLAVAGAASLPCDINGSAEMGIGVAADLHLAVSSPEIVLPGTISVTSTAEMVVTKVAGHKYLDDLIKTPFRFEKGVALRAGWTGPRHRGGRGEDREISHRMTAVPPIKRIAIIGAGDGGCAAAAQLGQRGFDIRLYGRSRAT